MAQPIPEQEDQNKLIMNATGKLVERITPWLLDVGSWIFGGLIAFNLIVMGALLTIGPADPPIMVATTALALVLPLDIAGLFLLRLVRDLEHVGIELDFETEVRQAMQSASPILGEQMASAKPVEEVRRRRVSITLIYSSTILTLSIVLTVAGMVAALWHMAWWIAVAFAAMVLLSLVIVTIAIASSQPPDTAEEKEQKRRYREAVIRQTKEQNQTSKGRT